MKTHFRNVIKVALAGAVVFPAVMLTSCGGGNKRPSLSDSYAEWNKSLEDSVENLKRDIDSCTQNIDILHDRINVWLRDFTRVENSREVEGYTIMNGWEKKYPPQSTSLVARISENEGLELIAVHQGSPFTAISVTVAGESASTESVRQDQALNYRRGNLSTVLFTGTKADSVAMLISNNELNNITVTFLNGKPVGKLDLPVANKKMISNTWQLYKSQQDVKRIEQSLPLLNEKMKLLRATIEKNKEK